MNTMYALLVCITILPISIAFLPTISKEEISLALNQNLLPLSPFMAAIVEIYDNIDNMTELINEDLYINTDKGKENHLETVLNNSAYLDKRIQEIIYFVENTKNQDVQAMIKQTDYLLERYHKFNEKFKQYVITIEQSKHIHRFYRFLIDNKYDEALFNYNHIKDNRTVIENVITDICKNNNFENFLKFLSKINNLTERAIIVDILFSDCLLNNRFGTITVCKLLKLYDKLKAVKNEEITEIVLILKDSITNYMLKLIYDINKKISKDNEISVIMVDFPFFTINRNNKPWYNILYWLEEQYDDTDRCNHAIGVLNADYIKIPPIA